MIGNSPVYLAGVVFAICGAIALAIQNIALRVGTDAGRATDAVAVVAGVNVVVLVPISVVRYYPDFGLTSRAIMAFLAAGLAGTMLGRALVYGSIERIGATERRLSSPVTRSSLFSSSGKPLRLPNCSGSVSSSVASRSSRG